MFLTLNSWIFLLIGYKCRFSLKNDMLIFVTETMEGVGRLTTLLW